MGKDELSVTQLRWLSRIEHEGVVRFERTETGDDHFFFNSGQTVPARTVRVLMRHGRLVPLGDGLFAGTSQSFVAR